MTVSMKLRRHVVVIGGGFGGLGVARALARAPVRVTLLDRQNHHLFQPLLYQVAMAGLAPGEVAVPIRSVLRLQDNVRVLLANVTHIDLAERVVTSSEAAPLEYDYLVVASGAENSYFGHDGWKHVAPGLKDIDEALEIRRRVLLAFEAAEREPDPLVQRRHLTFVVIGGGPTGVELAGAIAELATFVLARDFRAIHSDATRVILIEGGDRILNTFSPALSNSARASLADMGVEVRSGLRVTNIDASGVWCGDEHIEASRNRCTSGEWHDPMPACASRQHRERPAASSGLFVPVARKLPQRRHVLAKRTFLVRVARSFGAGGGGGPRVRGSRERLLPALRGVGGGSARELDAG